MELSDTSDTSVTKHIKTPEKGERTMATLKLR